MCATHFCEFGMFFGDLGNGLFQSFDLEKKFWKKEEDGGAERRRYDIVCGLGHVDVIVWMDQIFAEQFVGAFGDDFVGIHIV